MQSYALNLKALFFVAFVFLSSSAPLMAWSSDSQLKQETAENILADDLSGEDKNIRMAALRALGTAAGTVVVMNAQTGRVYSIVNQKWAITQGFKPCSTIKLVTGVAGIKENLISPNGDLVNGRYRLALNDALAYSNNTYFQKVGSGIGSAKLIDYALELGLGQKTGINAEDEYAGRLPFGNENPRIYSHADDFEVTPLQLAVMVSALTNGGKVVVPQLAKAEYKDAKFRGSLRRHLELEPTMYERLIPGMVGAVNYGTARRVKDENRQVAGKTGSCIFDDSWIGLFASVAPIRDPKFAVVVITRGKYARGKYSAAIAGSIYKTLAPRFKEKYNKALAKRNSALAINPRKPIVVPSSRKKTRTAFKPAPPIANTIITYKKDGKSGSMPEAGSRNAKAADSPKKMILIIDGKREIVRPRVVQE